MSAALRRIGALRVREGLVVVSLVEILASALFYSLGVRPDSSLYSLTGYWQVLDRFYLQHHLLSSLYYLHVAPPLFNVLTAFYLALPGGGVALAMVLVNAVLGLVLVGSSYLLACELEVPPWLAAVLGIVVALSPSVILYQSWEFYTFPTAASVTFATFCAARYLRTKRLSAGIGCFAGASAAVLLNSTFQWPWIVLVAAVVFLFGRPSARRLALSALPVLLVVGWYAKDAIVFGSYSTSSMLGMNLAKTTLLTAPPKTLNALVSEGRLSSIALVPPFQPVTAYEPAYAKPTTSTVPLLREVDKRDRVGPNLDNESEIAISSSYLHADLAFIAARPGDYLASISRGIRLWLVPTEQYSFLDDETAHISAYVDLVDRVGLLQPTRWNGSGYTPPVPSAAQISYGAAIVTALSLFGLPWLARRRRDDRVLCGALLVLWVTITYTFVLTSLVEYGENNRFRFDVGPLPLIGALVVVVGAVVAFRRRRLSASGPPVGRAR